MLKVDAALLKRGKEHDIKFKMQKKMEGYE